MIAILTRIIKERTSFAYLQGLYERARYCDGFGRTHETNQDWNEAYDRGANLADRLMGWE